MKKIITSLFFVALGLLGAPVNETVTIDSTTGQVLNVPAVDFSSNHLKLNGNTLEASFSPIAGSNALTSVGTVTSGVWHGTALDDTYIASASAWSAKQDALTLGAGVTSALAVDVGLAGAFVVNGGALGTPSSGNLANCAFPTLNQSTTGNAATATALITPRAINGVNFDGTAAITVPAAAGTLTGATLASGVTASSLTSAAGGAFGTAAYAAKGGSTGNVPSWASIATANYIVIDDGAGNLTRKDAAAVRSTFVLQEAFIISGGGLTYTAGNGAVNGTSGTLALSAINLAGTGSGGVTGILPNANTTAASANTSSAIVARDASGNFSAGTITAALTGTASGNLVSGGAAGTPSSITLTNGTGLPVSTGITGLGTGIATALAGNVGSAGAIIVNGGALGTPSGGTLTNCTFPTLNQNTTGYSSALKSATTTVDVAAATAPSIGQVLTATDSTHATWQTPSGGGGGGLTNWTESLATSSPNATIPVSALTATNAATNVDVAIVPKGTGAFVLQVPTGSSTTGNKRGANAVDLQTRGVANAVASGDQSFVAGYGNTASAQYSVAVGFGCGASGFGAQAFGYTATASNYYAMALGLGATSSGQAAIAIGRNCTITNDNGLSFGYYTSVTGYGAYSFGNNNLTSGNYATSLGNYSKADRNYMYSYACGQFAAVGDAQEARWVLRASTANSTPTEAFVDGSSVRVTIPSNKAIAGRVTVVGKKQSSASVAKYMRQFIAVNNGGTSTLAQSETIGTDYEDNASCDFALTVSDSNDALVFTVTGIAAENWRWVITVDAAEVSY